MWTSGVLRAREGYPEAAPLGPPTLAIFGESEGEMGGRAGGGKDFRFRQI